ncbi:hypothetical protein EJ08DRAFT_693696 [Tothia fuscella]|uniref:Uncharacterized protein n=1 Tax=Tothia fuscella TaxID=1048955 RepID=A0A9P4NYL1_9PEZI|nr:hypothetical protein EJ08DRAFT_693696 [Tothia fuscella]
MAPLHNSSYHIPYHGLSGEPRDKTYEQILYIPTGINLARTWNSHNSKDEIKRIPTHSVWEKSTLLDLTILRVNKTVSAEASATLYRINKVSFSEFWLDRVHLFFHERNITYIRHIHLQHSCTAGMDINRCTQLLESLTTRFTLLSLTLPTIFEDEVWRLPMFQCLEHIQILRRALLNGSVRKLKFIDLDYMVKKLVKKLDHYHSNSCLVWALNQFDCLIPGKQSCMEWAVQNHKTRSNVGDCLPCRGTTSLNEVSHMREGFVEFEVMAKVQRIDEEDGVMDDRVLEIWKRNVGEKGFDRMEDILKLDE